MNNYETMNDRAWCKLFDKYNILNEIKEKGFFNITSKQINLEREARLMAKFDQRKDLPRLFKKNKLSILPVGRGHYIIGKFETYKDVEEKNRYKVPIEYLTFPEHIESIDFENITSEATAINCAYVSGILADFLKEDALLPTVSGRMSSNSFNFNINRLQPNLPINIQVKNAQIEIDGGYEGQHSLALIEAKMSLAQDFMIRQIYYPFRLWKEKVTKPVKPIFFSYSNNIFYLSEYHFEDPNNYNSLVLLNQGRYSLEDQNITLDDIIKISTSSQTCVEPELPFPQADSFERVINLCERLKAEKGLYKNQLTNIYGFTGRQTDYYTNSLLYLELACKQKQNSETFFLLSEKGKKVLRLSYKQRQLALAKMILEHSVFNKIFKLYMQRQELPSKREVVPIMKESNLYKIGSEDTYGRRASTILGWLNWILDLQT